MRLRTVSRTNEVLVKMNQENKSLSMPCVTERSGRQVFRDHPRNKPVVSIERFKKNDNGPPVERRYSDFAEGPEDQSELVDFPSPDDFDSGSITSVENNKTLELLGLTTSGSTAHFEPNVFRYFRASDFYSIWTMSIP